ncbi:hypothetical protein EIP91_006257 [Steccherinum ochraceum]|uniref:UBX domain-containing protein n=1 Tax=Steccherinum ochraceum TaxID=92696 RepID=A0A4R0R5X6_9APHY|nr:hypothetical protein EIP91_006257 [Steccherinum ochraceum]
MSSDLTIHPDASVSSPQADQPNPPTDVAMQSFEPPKVQFRLYRPPQSKGGAPIELPDAYFQPSPADLKAAQASLAARSQSLQNAPLRTQAMREAEDKARRAKWPTTTIRVRFPDRTQLEKAFPSNNKIRSVYAFVRESLREDVKPIKFVLYQTPPKRELKVSDPNVRDLSLFDLQLAPSSVLHLKFEDESLNHITVPAPLSPEVLAHAEEFPIPPDPEEAPAPSGGRTLGSSSSSSAPGTSSASKTGSGTTLGSTEKKIPKWLKLSKK